MLSTFSYVVMGTNEASYYDTVQFSPRSEKAHTIGRPEDMQLASTFPEKQIIDEKVQKS